MVGPHAGERPTETLPNGPRGARGRTSTLLLGQTARATTRRDHETGSRTDGHTCGSAGTGVSGCAAWTRAAGRCRLAATWLLQANLYGLSPADPVTFAAIAALLTVVGAGASMCRRDAPRGSTRSTRCACAPCRTTAGGRAPCPTTATALYNITLLRSRPDPCAIRGARRP